MYIDKTQILYAWIREKIVDYVKKKSIRTESRFDNACFFKYSLDYSLLKFVQKFTYYCDAYLQEVFVF